MQAFAAWTDARLAIITLVPSYRGYVRVREVRRTNTDGRSFVGDTGHVATLVYDPFALLASHGRGAFAAYQDVDVFLCVLDARQHADRYGDVNLIGGQAKVAAYHFCIRRTEQGVKRQCRQDLYIVQGSLNLKQMTGLAALHVDRKAKGDGSLALLSNYAYRSERETGEQDERHLQHADALGYLIVQENGK